MSGQLNLAQESVEILIVEDSPTQAEKLQYLLEQHSYRVTVANNGKHALACLNSTMPALVISDINMPEMNGFELCQHIKADQRTQNLPVVLLTYLSNAQDVVDGLACGADGFITKPYSEDYLLSFIKRTLENRPSRTQALASIEVEINLAGQSRVISAIPEQTVRLLLSTFEAAIQRNTELVQSQHELNSLNEHLEDLVAERSAALLAEIAERKEATDRILYLASVLEHVSDGIVSTDINSMIQSWNSAAEAMFGYRAEEVIGRHYAEVVVYDYLDAIEPRVDQLLTNIGPWSGEVCARHKDGTLIYVLVASGVLKNSAGVVTGFSAVLHDVTIRRKSAAALVQSERAHRTLFENVPVGLYRTAADGQLLDANPAMVNIFGYTDRATFLTNNIGNLYVDMTANQVFKQEIEKSDPLFNYETEFYRQDGTIFWVEDNIHTVRDEAGNVVSYEGSMIDITERKQAGEQINKQVGRLTALRAIDTAITAGRDLPFTLNVLLEHVITQLKVDAADVLLLKTPAQELQYAAGYGFRTGIAQTAHIRLGESFAGRAALERRTIEAHNPAQIQESPYVATLWANEGFVDCYAVPLISKGEVKGVLEVFHRARLPVDSDWLDFLETLAGQTAIAIDNAQLFDGLAQSNMDLRAAYDATIEGWSRALDLRDKETEGHSLRVTKMTLDLARALNIREEELIHLQRGALLHDIGKMGVPDSILLKPGKLTDEEWVIMRSHPQLAYDLLSPIAFLHQALDIPYCHHEKWDGTGYPRRMQGEDIPLAARIFAVVDVWDALRSDRPYRLAVPEADAREHIRLLSGTHFDPRAVDAFFNLLAQAD